MSEELPNLGLLIKLLKMTTSSNDAEAIVAMRKANEQLIKFGGDWERLLLGKVTVIGDPFAGLDTPPPPRAHDAAAPMPPSRPAPPPPPYSYTPPPPRPPQPPPAPKSYRPYYGQTTPAQRKAQRAKQKLNTLLDL